MPANTALAASKRRSASATKPGSWSRLKVPPVRNRRRNQTNSTNKTPIGTTATNDDVQNDPSGSHGGFGSAGACPGVLGERNCQIARNIRMSSTQRTSVRLAFDFGGGAGGSGAGRNGTGVSDITGEETTSREKSQPTSVPAR